MAGSIRYSSFTAQKGKHDQVLDYSNLASGVYNLVVQTEQGIHTRRLVILN
jgi:hypothetical protein